MKVMAVILPITLLGALWPSTPLRADDLAIYPKGGQSPEQQEKDKFECYSWAKDDSGFDPMAPPTATEPPPQQQTAQRIGLEPSKSASSQFFVHRWIFSSACMAAIARWLMVAAESVDAPQFIAVDLTNSDIPLDLSGLAQSVRLRNRENLNGRKFLIQILQLTGGLRLPIQSISRPDIRRLQ